jgi:hypothetical protein
MSRLWPYPSVTPYCCACPVYGLTPVWHCSDIILLDHSHHSALNFANGRQSNVRSYSIFPWMGFHTFEVDVWQLIVRFYSSYWTALLEISLGTEIRLTSKKHMVRYTLKFYTSIEPTGSDYRQFPHKTSPSHVLPVFIGLLNDSFIMSGYKESLEVFFISDLARAVLPLIIWRCTVFAYLHAILSSVLIWNWKRTGNTTIPTSNICNWNRKYL